MSNIFKSIRLDFCQAISAERNANAEKIAKMQMEIDSLRFIGNERFSQVKSLESKLADAENELEIAHTDESNLEKEYFIVKERLADAEKKYQAEYVKVSSLQLEVVRSVPINLYQELEAEAKAVRSKTIEECAKVARDLIFDKCNGECTHDCDSDEKVEKAIRALNNKKE